MLFFINNTFINDLTHLNGFKMGKDRLYKKGLKIDDRNRVVIPTELLQELRLNNGDQVCVYANFEENKIVIKKEVKK
jgi:hypothetical protein